MAPVSVLAAAAAWLRGQHCHLVAGRSLPSALRLAGSPCVSSSDSHSTKTYTFDELKTLYCPLAMHYLLDFTFTHFTYWHIMCFYSLTPLVTSLSGCGQRHKMPERLNLENSAAL